MQASAVASLATDQLTDDAGGGHHQHHQPQHHQHHQHHHHHHQHHHQHQQQQQHHHHCYRQDGAVIVMIHLIPCKIWQLQMMVVSVRQVQLLVIWGNQPDGQIATFIISYP